ncbi:YrhB domain-containing protein [Streptomyces sp. MS19]|uniref:YrhB domain-containing protein n=1 Tax=Streptomyces sp. MS19 TaxID=3385972 RepID=UPI00399F8328
MSDTGTRMLDDAVRAATDFLESVFADEGYTLVMLPELSEEHRTAWTVVFDTQEHIGTGDMTKAPFTRVLAVPKDGSQPRFPPTMGSFTEFLESLEAEQ